MGEGGQVLRRLDRLISAGAAMMAMRVLRLAMMAALAAVTAAGVAGAQEFPDRLIRIIVPSGPGGPPDIIARLIAERLQSSFGQSVVVEDRPGASGAIGAKAVAAADPDGYTLLLGFTSPLTIIPAIMKNAGFDPRRSFVAVARLTDSSLVLVVHARFPADSLRELVERARSHPGALAFGSAGMGNQVHLTGEMFKASAGIDLLHVPYKSGAEMTTAVLGEQVQLTFPDISLALPLVRQGRLKALAVLSAARRPELPDTPTMVESGYRDLLSSFWTGLVAPAGTPAPVVRKLNDAVNAGLRSAEMQASLAKLGVEARPGSPEEFASFIAAESRKWSAIADAAGIRVD